MAKPQNNLELDLQADAATPEQMEAASEREHMREEYRTRLAEKLKDPEFRKIEGFPIGTDEAILALSDPPYYTACPNPFIKEWLHENAKPYDANTDDYHREPFAADVSEGKNDPIYNAHSYHTKVPHRAIMRYILHYTQPGDVIYDGFCGTGMTGVAAQMCGNTVQVESLGYKVQTDGTISDYEGQSTGQIGARKAILSDLSPVASYIAYNFNAPLDPQAFKRETKRILGEAETLYGWMYTTLHDASAEEITQAANAVRTCSSFESLCLLIENLRRAPATDPTSRIKFGRINYTVWSDVFTCPNCGSEIVFWDEAVDDRQGEVRDTFQCPTCRALVTKRQCGRANSTRFDQALNEPIIQSKQVPVLVNYVVSGKRHERRLDEFDLSLIEVIGTIKPNNGFPTSRMPDGDESRRNDPIGLTHVHHFYTARNLVVNGHLWDKLRTVPYGGFLFTSTHPWTTRQNRLLLSNHFKKKGGVIGQTLAGTLYVSSISIETNAIYRFELRAGSSIVFGMGENAITTCQSATDVRDAIPNDSIDYIFTDPPFGGNIMYSELNALWESWLGVLTRNSSEAITNRAQKKQLAEYQELMTRSFAEYFRVLKPSRWMTVEFHNSSNAVWNAIQEGLEHVGFVVADVRVLTKEHNTFKQVNSASAVKQDLVISCYKPSLDFELRFQRIKGQPEGVLEFVRQHLSMLPIAPLTKDGMIEPVAERNRFLLFDRMIAYHLQRGAAIPLDASAFYRLLEEQFTSRDEMYFLPEQAARYDALKSRGYETEQLAIFVSDEKSIVRWVRAELSKTPQTLGDLTPKFMQEAREWPPHEPLPELRELLREYFIQSAAGIWRIPDPDDERDIAVLRKNAMLRQFQEYTRDKGHLKTFRKEAVLEGFKECYETKQFGVIVATCERIPEKIFREIPDFVMFYDIAKDHAPEQVEQLDFVWE